MNIKFTQNNVHGENHAYINGEEVEFFQTKAPKQTDSELREEKLKELWHKRNPHHQDNLSTGKDMFWGTVLCIFDDMYSETFHQREQQIYTELMEKIWEKRKSMDDDSILEACGEMKNRTDFAKSLSMGKKYEEFAGYNEAIGDVDTIINNIFKYD